MFRVHVTYIIGLFVACEVIANITAGRMTRFGPFDVPGAIYIFAITFTIIDLINEVLGKQGARRVVLAAVVANCLLAAYSLIVLALPEPQWFQNGAAYHAVLGLTPRIVAASLLASLLAGLADVELFARLRRRVNAGWRVVASNALGTLLDSMLFITLAFAGVPGFPLLTLLGLIAGQYIVKMLVTFVSVPLIYLVKVTVNVQTEQVEVEAA